MEEVYTYPCVFYYEKNSKQQKEPYVHICFPDFIEAGIPASSVSKSKEVILMTARELLQDTVKIMLEENGRLPDATFSLEKLSIDRTSYFEKLGRPYRIEILNISVNLLERIEEDEKVESIISGRIQNNKCIISSIAGIPIREGTYPFEKLRALYQAINSKGESIALNINGKRIELSAQQSLILREELAMLADELDRE